MEKAGEEKYLFAYDEDRFLVKIFYRDIFFIETIKSSHYCTVVHREGKHKMRGDIIHLEKVLGDPFLRVRSSTLANINYVSKIDRINRALYFDRKMELYCTYAAGNYSVIKQCLQIRSYRSE